MASHEMPVSIWMHGPAHDHRHLGATALRRFQNVLSCDQCTLIQASPHTHEHRLHTCDFIVTDHRLKNIFFFLKDVPDSSMVSEFAAKHGDLSSISKTHMVERRNGQIGSSVRGEFPNSETGPVPRCGGRPASHCGAFLLLS